MIYKLLFCTCVMLTSSQEIVEKLSTKDIKDLSDSPVALWMQRSGVAVRVCQRVQSTHQYNSGLSPMTSQLTVGRCQPQLIKANAHVTQGKLQECSGIRACLPTKSEVIHIRTAEGITDVNSALDCSCATQPSGCQRRPLVRVFYRGTKYEREVDVGKCAGNCGNQKCRPLAIKTVAVKTPNGRKLVQVIEKCGCQSSCYRMVYKKAFPVMSSELSDKRTSTKVIDVGVCSGMSSGCSGTVQGKCLYWVFSQNKTKDQPSNHKVCLLRSQPRRRGCYPNKTRAITLNTTTSSNMKVNIIESCACL